MINTAWSRRLGLRVELGTGETFDPTLGTTWGAARWGDPGAHWAGVEPLWVDVTCHFRNVELQGGVDYTVGRFTAGSAQLVADNGDGWASLMVEQAMGIRVRRQVRVVATIQAGPLAGTDVPLFRGFIDAITPTYLAGARPGVQFDCVDALSIFAADDPLELGAPVGAGDLSGQRIGRLLDRVGWPATMRDLDTGQVEVQATTMARNYADEMGVTTDSEGGALFIRPDGYVAFRDRDWLRTQAAPTYIIGNVPGADVCPSSWVTGQSMGEIVSKVALANSGGEAHNYVDGTTFAEVGPATFRRFDLICADEGQLDVLAGRILQVRGAVTARVRGTTLSLLADPRWAGAFLADLRYGARFTASYVDPITPAGNFTMPTVCTRIAHRIDADGDWVVTLGLEDASPYVPAQPWGAARWGIDTWTSASVQRLEALTRRARQLRRDLEGALHV